MNVWLCNANIATRTVSIVSAILILVSSAASAKTWRVHNVGKSSTVHMRELPNSHSKIIAYVPANATGLSGKSCKGHWCQVVYKGHKGWIYKKYLTADKAKAPSSNTAAHKKTSKSLTATPLPEGQEIPIKSNSNGAPIPVYAFPSDRLPVAGRLSANTTSVQSMGACIRTWCYIRSGSLVGWLPQDRFAKEGANAESPKQSAESQKPEQAAEKAAEKPQVTNSLPLTEAKEEAPAFNNTEHTATQITPLPSAIPKAIESGTTKKYSLAGLSRGAPLTIRQQPSDISAVVGSIPPNAKDVEGLHKCVKKWCLIRHRRVSGWVHRRHLADDSLKGTKSYLVTGVGLMGKLEVWDSPDKNGGVVGHIPAYATGIVPIGSCSKTWCHVRYLGLAGWVNSKYLMATKRGS
ncbi:MAG: SH3 domain-containing protein [Alphaproteobacteria bacterium]